jgi:hypothetical protein
MKKAVAVAILLVGIFVSAEIFAADSSSFGAGVFVNGGYVGGAMGSVGLTAKLPSIPVAAYLTYNFMLPSMGVAADYWVFNQSISGTPLEWYFALGAFAGFNKKDSEFDLSLRFPVGLQFFPVAKKFELFLELVPAVPLLPTPAIGFGADLGFRGYF